MGRKTHSYTTTQLLNRIKKGKDIGVLREYEDEMDAPTLGEFLQEELDQKGWKVSQLAEKIMLDRTFVYQMLSGKRQPNRVHLIRIALALQLSLEETQRMLRIAQKGELYPRVRYDAAIIFAVQKKLSVAEANEMLEELGEPPIL